VKNVLETITHVGILEQNPTNVGRSRFIMVLSVRVVYIIHYSIEPIAFSTEYTLFNIVN